MLNLVIETVYIDLIGLRIKVLVWVCIIFPRKQNIVMCV